jgi:hypothetical protein
LKVENEVKEVREDGEMKYFSYICKKLGKPSLPLFYKTSNKSLSKPIVMKNNIVINNVDFKQWLVSLKTRIRQRFYNLYSQGVFETPQIRQQLVSELQDTKDKDITTGQQFIEESKTPALPSIEEIEEKLKT